MNNNFQNSIPVSSRSSTVGARPATVLQTAIGGLMTTHQTPVLVFNFYPPNRAQPQLLEKFEQLNLITERKP